MCPLPWGAQEQVDAIDPTALTVQDHSALAPVADALLFQLAESHTFWPHATAGGTTADTGGGSTTPSP